MDSVKTPTASTLVKELYSDREKTADVTFIVESSRIPAHRNVLAALSPKYKAQFYGNQPDEVDVHVENVSATAFHEFIKLFYFEEANFTLENVEDILNLVKQCLVTHFQTQCENFLENSINSNNLCWIYQLAILYNLKSVRDACELEIGVKFFTSNDFFEIGLEILLHILDIESFNCSEFKVFGYCIEWAKAVCARKGRDHTKGKNLRAELGNVISKIRFSSISICDFVNFHKSYDGFFTAEEFIEITYIIGGLLEFTSQNFNHTIRKEIPTGTVIAKYRIVKSFLKRKVIEGELQNITAMEEYEGKSVEELRSEDYFADRKGPLPGR